MEKDKKLCPLCANSGKVFRLPERTMGYTFGPHESISSLDEHYEPCPLCLPESSSSFQQQVMFW